MLSGATAMSERTIKQTCGFCASKFQVAASRIKYERGKHCSKACQYAAIKARPSNGGIITCERCGTQFSRPKSIVEGARYCTRACRDKHWIGAQTPNWQNGDGVYKRGPRWYSIRRAILARDKVCQHCGEDGKLHVHHKIPFRMFDDPDVANDADNLISLCPPCHRKEDAKSKWVGIDGGIIIRMDAGGAAWQLAREKGMV